MIGSMNMKAFTSVLMLLAGLGLAACTGGDSDDSPSTGSNGGGGGETVNPGPEASLEVVTYPAWSFSTGQGHEELYSAALDIAYMARHINATSGNLLSFVNDFTLFEYFEPSYARSLISDASLPVGEWQLSCRIDELGADLSFDYTISTRHKTHEFPDAVDDLLTLEGRCQSTPDIHLVGDGYERVLGAGDRFRESGRMDNSYGLFTRSLDLEVLSGHLSTERGVESDGTQLRVRFDTSALVKQPIAMPDFIYEQGALELQVGSELVHARSVEDQGYRFQNFIPIQVPGTFSFNWKPAAITLDNFELAKQREEWFAGFYRNSRVHGQGELGGPFLSGRFHFNISEATPLASDETENSPRLESGQALVLDHQGQELATVVYTRDYVTVHADGATTSQSWSELCSRFDINC